MIFKSFPLTIRNKEDAEMFERLPMGQRNDIILALIREYVGNMDQEEINRQVYEENKNASKRK